MLFTEFIANLATAFYDKFTVGGKLPVDIAVGDSVELTNTTVAKALAQRAVNAAGAAFIEPPTQADVQALATQATAAAILAKLIAAPATEAKQDTLKAAVDLLATQATLAQVLAALTPTAVKSWVTTDNWKTLADPTVVDPSAGAILTADWVGGAARLLALPAGKANHCIALVGTDSTVTFDAYYDAFEIHVLPTAKTDADYLRAGVKCVDNLRVSDDPTESNSQIKIESQAAYLYLRLRTVTASVPNPGGRFLVASW